MDIYNPNQRSGKLSGNHQRSDQVRSRRYSGMLKNLFLIVVVSLWSYWIVYCQPQENKYEVNTTISASSSSIGTTTMKASSISSPEIVKESPPSKMEVNKDAVKTSESEEEATVQPTSVTDESEEQENFIGEDDIGVDESESESENGDDDGGVVKGWEEEEVDGDANEKEGQAEEDLSPNDLRVIEPIKSDVIPVDKRFENHLYMFVHIGKTGGKTLQSNIRTICLRNQVEQNILWQRRTKKTYTGVTQCMRRLDQQRNSTLYNPTTEMVISNERVVGFLHMNFLTYWWNANDDGEAVDMRSRKRKRNIQDDISCIIDSGAGYSKDPIVFQNAPLCKIKDDGMTKSTAFLVPVRDPIDRLVSAFNYHHPQNRKNARESCDNLNVNRFSEWVTYSFYCHCFDTVNDLVNVFMEDKSPSKYVPRFGRSTEKISCLKIAEGVLLGKSHYKRHSNHEKSSEEAGLEKYLNFDLELIKKRKKILAVGHITMNYGYYYRRTFLKHPEKDIVAIRTDHMWEDLQRLEYKLGGTAPIKGAASGHVSVDHGSHNYIASETITDSKELQVICCVIPSEAKIYIELLERAINLSEEQKKESITAFKKRCNLELCSSS